MLSFPLRNSYPAIALGGLIEGPLTGIACGVGWALGWVDPRIAFVLIWAGALAQDLTLYGLGRLAARSPRVRGFIRRRKLLRDSLAPLAEAWRHEMLPTLLLTKLSYGVYAPVVILAGLARASWWQFLALSSAIEAPLDCAWLGLGFGLQRVYGAGGAYGPQIVTVAGLVALGLLVLLFRRSRRRLDARSARGGRERRERAV